MGADLNILIIVSSILAFLIIGSVVAGSIIIMRRGGRSCVVTRDNFHRSRRNSAAPFDIEKNHRHISWESQRRNIIQKSIAGRESRTSLCSDIAAPGRAVTKSSSCSALRNEIKEWDAGLPFDQSKNHPHAEH